MSEITYYGDTVHLLNYLQSSLHPIGFVHSSSSNMFYKLSKDYSRAAEKK